MDEDVSRQIALMCVQPEQSHYAVPPEIVDKLFAEKIILIFLD